MLLHSKEKEKYKDEIFNILLLMFSAVALPACLYVNIYVIQQKHSVCQRTNLLLYVNFNIRKQILHKPNLQIQKKSQAKR